MDVKKEKERESDNNNNNKKKCLCELVFFLCMLLIKKNEFNLYAQISKGQIKIMLNFPWKCRTCIYIIVWKSNN